MEILVIINRLFGNFILFYFYQFILKEKQEFQDEYIRNL